MKVSTLVASMRQLANVLPLTTLIVVILHMLLTCPATTAWVPPMVASGHNHQKQQQHQLTPSSPLASKTMLNVQSGLDGLFDKDGNDDDDDNQRRKVRVPRRGGRSSQRDRYEGEDYYDEDYDDEDFGATNKQRYYEEDEEEDWDDEDEDAFAEDRDLLSNVIIPNPLLDSIDPDGAADRFPELASDPRFWFDLVLFLAAINFLSDIGPRNPGFFPWEDIPWSTM